MITAQELRIGNWVNLNWDGQTKDLPISGIVVYDRNDPRVWFEEYDDFHIDCINPIPLTPEWLEIAGFEKHGNSNEYWTFWQLSNGWYICESHHDEKSLWIENGKFYWGEDYLVIPFLHDLQNFYFAHTRKELSIIY